MLGIDKDDRPLTEAIRPRTEYSAESQRERPALEQVTVSSDICPAVAASSRPDIFERRLDFDTRRAEPTESSDSTRDHDRKKKQCSGHHEHRGILCRNPKLVRSNECEDPADHRDNNQAGKVTGFATEKEPKRSRARCNTADPTGPDHRGSRDDR